MELTSKQILEVSCCLLVFSSFTGCGHYKEYDVDINGKSFLDLEVIVFEHDNGSVRDIKKVDSPKKLFFTRAIVLDDSEPVHIPTWHETYNEIIPGALEYFIVTEQEIDDCSPFTGFCYYKNEGMVKCAHGVEMGKYGKPQCMGLVECSGYGMDDDGYYCAEEL